MVGGADWRWRQDAKTLSNLIFDIERDRLLQGYNKMTTWSFLASALYPWTRQELNPPRGLVPLTTFPQTSIIEEGLTPSGRTV